MELFSLNVFSGHLNTENFGECGLQFVIHGQSTVFVMPVLIIFLNLFTCGRFHIQGGSLEGPWHLNLHGIEVWLSG